MVRRSKSAGPCAGGSLGASIRPAKNSAAAAAAAKAAEVDPRGWSTAPQRDPESSEDDLDSCSEDSWGSVVDTGVDALQKAVNKVRAES